MEYIKKRAFRVLLVMLLVAVGVGVRSNSHAIAGVPDSVIINELMYNPSTNQDDEYLELYNTTGSDIDLTGWCFSAGITLVTSYSSPNCFDTGTAITAHGYIVVSPNPSQTNTTYGITPAASYAGTNLSNGGETVTLVDDTSQVIDSVEYDDAAPWPTSPDGQGPSLELVDPSSDNSNGANWLASLAVTPGAQNSVVNLSLPQISNVTDPNDITADQTVKIEATVSDAQSVDLKYKVNFDTVLIETMYDNGTNGDESASDGVYTAVIPQQEAGKLVRFKVEANNTDGVQTSPSASDSQNYHGYVVKDLSVTSQLPIFNWFMKDDEYEDMVTNHTSDNQYFDVVLAYGNDVYDNVKVRVKGEYSRSFPKKSLKFKMPSGYKMAVPGYFDDPISEFHMNGEWLDETKAITQTAWQIAKEIGIKTPNVFGTRLQRNGQYHGYFLTVDKYSREYMQRNGLDGELYDSGYTKVYPDDGDNTNVTAFSNNYYRKPKTAERREKLFNQADIPNLVNFTAFDTLINSHDGAFGKNQFQYYDVNNTGRWSFLPWDRDIIVGIRPPIVTPYTTPDYISGFDRYPMTTLYDETDGKAMFFRRVRTLVDKYFGDDNKFLEMYQDNADLSAPEAALDVAKWGIGTGSSGNGFFTTDRPYWERTIPWLKKQYTARFRLDRAIPEPQAENPVIDIETVNNSLNQLDRYVVLKNNGSSAVDISGWQLEELSFEFPQGTVLAAGSEVAIPRSDVDFRSSNSGAFVAGQLNHDVPGGGQLTLKRNNNTTSDVVWF